jgi:hypothetical protein
LLRFSSNYRFQRKYWQRFIWNYPAIRRWSELANRQYCT